MIDAPNLKIGDKIRYDIPDNFFIDNDKIKSLNGKTTEVIDVVRVLHPETLDTIIKIIVKDVNNGEARAIPDTLYNFLTLI